MPQRRLTRLARVVALAVALALGGAGCAPDIVIGYAFDPMDGGDGDGDATPDAEPTAGSGGAGSGGDGGGTAFGDASPTDGLDGGDAGDAADAAPADASDGSDAAPAAPPEVTWPSGGHPGNDYPDYVAFGDWRGRPIEVANVFPDRTSWDGIVQPAWPVDMFAPFDGILILSLPLYPEGMGNNQECADGLYESQWESLGSFLVSRNRGDAVIRLGWGPNDLDHDWSVANGPTPDVPDPQDLENWIACFQRVVDAIRSTAPGVTIDWSINSIGSPMVALYDPFVTYPGDDHVDYIGLEVFDMYPPSFTDEQWEETCNALTGLCSVAAFARLHGKQLGIAEWSVIGCDGTGAPDTSGNAGGDNPFFIQKVVETFAENADIMAYDAYFEDGNVSLCGNISDGSSNPLSAAHYRELYRLD